mmetsp:Transcript_33189/g.130656  ORF Transcript_33189/g.130656 Transcript_33189/m.130656 type:complete len:133 (-) Transcript_33189:659-1057(-)
MLYKLAHYLLNRQELEEVEQSLKTSTEVFNIIREGEELSIARKKQAQMSKYPGDEKTKKLLQLKSWHESGMVPRSVTTWDQVTNTCSLWLLVVRLLTKYYFNQTEVSLLEGRRNQEIRDVRHRIWIIQCPRP